MAGVQSLLEGLCILRLGLWHRLQLEVSRHVTRIEPALTSRSDVPFSGRLVAKRNPDCQVPSKEMAR